jgi:hypothetical protein
MLRAGLVVVLGLGAFFLTRILLQGPPINRRASPAPQTDSPGDRLGAWTGGQQLESDEGTPLARPDEPLVESIWNGSRKPSASDSRPQLTLPPLSDYDLFALGSTATENARALVTAKVVKAMVEGKSCLGSDHWGDSRILLVLQVAPSNDALVVESLEELSVFSGSALSDKTLECLRSYVSTPFRLPISAAGALPRGSLHVLLTLPGRKDFPAPSTH